MTRLDSRAHLTIAFWGAGTLLLVLLVAGFARAHTAPKGWDYPWECCHDHDCAEIADNRVTTSPAGYVIDGKFVVPQSQVRQSPDGKYHACFPNPERLQCFFAPPAAY